MPRLFRIRVVRPALLVPFLVLAGVTTTEAQPLLEATTVDRLAERCDAGVAGSLTVLPIDDERLLGSLQVEDLLFGPEAARHATFDLTRSPEDGPMSGGRFVVFLAEDERGWRPLAGHRGFIAYEAIEDLEAIAARLHRIRAARGPQERVSIWAEDLLAPVERLRQDAALQLATDEAVRSAKTEEIESIGEALATADETTAVWLIRALGASRHPRALELLLELAEDAGWNAHRHEIARAASTFEADTVREALSRRLGVIPADSDASGRLTCLAGRLGLVEHRPSIQALLLRSDEALCCAALEALAVLRDPASIEAIAERLRDGRPAVRRAAAIALAAYRRAETNALLRAQRERETAAELRWLIDRLLDAPAYYLAPLDPRR